MHDRLARVGRIVFLLVLGLAVPAPLEVAVPAHAQGLDFGSGPVLLLAERVEYDQVNDVVTAEGEVEISRAGRRLFADRVRLSQTADLLEAEGNVILLEPTGEAVFADRVELTGDLRSGVIEQLRGRLADNSMFAAAQARRLEGTRIEMDKAIYSPCRLCPGSDDEPLWQIKADRVIHDETKRTISYRNAFFEVAGVPVGYTPYFRHPDPTVERESGFLAPSVGSDSELGFTLETPYYFALAPNYDFTFSPILTTEEGPVLTGEWRHLVASGSYQLAGSVTYGTGPAEQQGDIPDEREVRGHVEGEGNFLLARDWRWGYDLAVASDDTYLQRYDFSNKSILNNRLFTERIWQRNYAALNAYGFQGLRATDDQGLIPVVLPLAELQLASDPGWRGSRLTFDGSVLALTRIEGLDTRRLSATGGWELPWLGPLGDSWRLRLSLRGDLYHTDGDPVTFEENGTNLESRAVPRATLNWSWPLLSGAFGVSQVLEPTVMATWAPDNINDSAIPNEDSRDLEFDDTNLFEPNRFAGLDRIEPGARVSYGLRYSLFAQADAWFSGLFGQSYRLSDDETFDPATGLDGKFSDYVGSLSASPHPWLNVSYRFRLDRDSLSLLRNELWGSVGPRRIRFDVNYLSLEDDPEAENFREREEITAGVLVRLTPTLSLRARTRRNLRRDESIAHNFGLVYRNPCLLLIAGLERRFTENRDASSGTKFTVRITLQHLGEVEADSSLFGL